MMATFHRNSHFFLEMRPFLVPVTAIEPQTGKTLPKSLATMPHNKGVKRIDHLGIMLGYGRWPLVVRRPR
jgi:hypothetical protein